MHLNQVIQEFPFNVKPTHVKRATTLTRNWTHMFLYTLIGSREWLTEPYDAIRSSSMNQCTFCRFLHVASSQAARPTEVAVTMKWVQWCWSSNQWCYPRAQTRGRKKKLCQLPYWRTKTQSRSHSRQAPSVQLSNGLHKLTETMQSLFNMTASAPKVQASTLKVTTLLYKNTCSSDTST